MSVVAPPCRGQPRAGGPAASRVSNQAIAEAARRPPRDRPRDHGLGVAGLADASPVARRRAALVGHQEAAAHLDALRPQGECRREPAPVHHAAGRHDRHVHGRHHLGHQREGSHQRHDTVRGDVEGGAVSTGLRALGHDHLGPRGDREHGVLHTRGHRDQRRPGGHRQIAHRGGVAEPHAHRPGSGLEAGLHEFGRCRGGPGGRARVRQAQLPPQRRERDVRILTGRVGWRRRGHQHVDADRPVGEGAGAGDRLPRGADAHAREPERAEPPGRGDRGHQLGRRRPTGHPGEEHRMADAQQPAQRILEWSRGHRLAVNRSQT